jgi:hypothetical protein
MSRQDGSDWHGSRISKGYKDNYYATFGGAECPECKIGMLYLAEDMETIYCSFCSKKLEEKDESSD